MLKICMDFGPYDAFPSSDVPEMVDQQNSWNSLVISAYFLYLEMKFGYVGGRYVYFTTANSGLLIIIVVIRDTSRTNAKSGQLSNSQQGIMV
jgi:hypothetical protein